MAGHLEFSWQTQPPHRTGTTGKLKIPNLRKFDFAETFSMDYQVFPWNWKNNNDTSLCHRINQYVLSY
eukprot:scaffold471_cov318-Ochromonas_danica.AAC.10